MNTLTKSKTIPSQKSRLHLSIRLKLILPFVILILMVLIIFLPYTTNLIAERLEIEADKRLVQTSESFGLLLEQTEDLSSIVASLVANLPEVEEIGTDRRLAADILTPLKEELGLQELSYYPPDHRPDFPALFYGGPIIERQNVISQRTLDARDVLIEEAISSQQTVSGIVIAPQSSQITGVAPVIHDGEITGIVVAVFFINNSYVQEIGIILNVDAAIISDNAVIASSVDRSSGFELLLQEGFLNPNETSATNIQYEDNLNRRLLGHPLTLDGQQQGHILVVRTLEDVATVEAQIQNVILAFVGMTIIMIAIYFVGIIFNFANPLKRVADAAEKVSAGQLSERVDIVNIWLEDEVTDLSRNFNVMTERLEGLYNELEDKVQERTIALQDALAELEIKRDEALEANRTKSLFLANMSHELRTPLNAIIGYSEMLEEEAEDFGYSNIVPDLQKIRTAGTHLLALINDILDLSKIEAGKIEFYLEDFIIEDVIDDVGMTVQPVVEKNNNKFVIEVGEELGTMHADITRMRQVMVNMLSNAAKFTENGIVTLKARRYDNEGNDWIEIAVSDTGIGMSEEQTSKIFGEFAQADVSTTRKFGGTGLGLSISLHFCQLMGGDITVTSKEGEGSTFTVSLPAKVILHEKFITNEIPAVSED